MSEESSKCTEQEKLAAKMIRMVHSLEVELKVITAFPIEHEGESQPPCGASPAGGLSF